ncbi:nicotinamide riboside transporter PnuC [Streptococcus dentiloxodontae]
MNYLNKRIEGAKQTIEEMTKGFSRMAAGMKRAGFLGTLKIIWDDLFANRSLPAWLYLLVLGSFPVWLELIYEHEIKDWIGMICSLTGIICVIFVSEGRASNYFFGLINSVIYLILALQKGFYGEVLTTLYFTAMQPIGLLVWIYQAQFKKEEQSFVARKLDIRNWIKYLFITILWWLTFGFIYKSIGANRPFRDSVTDATNGVGQLLMTAVYREQWIFWAATNIFSIYLWWGESLQIQGKYFIYLINSLVGWYQWSKAAKKTEV